MITIPEDRRAAAKSVGESNSNEDATNDENIEVLEGCIVELPFCRVSDVSQCESEEEN